MNLFDFLKDRLQIVDVIQEYVAIKKAGIYYKGRCPFHHEKDASFTVSPHKQIFYCFGCHATGDVIAFIAQIESCSQIEAAKFIIDKYNIELPPHLLNEKQDLAHTITKKNNYFHLCQSIADWCTLQLTISPPAQEYLKERLITAEILKQFEVGYFSPGLANLKKLQQHLQQQGFLIKDLIDNHIVIDSPKGIYSPFEDRIIFPIADHMGRCCGFGGRVFKPADERAKYYNSRENTFFTKGSLLFGLQHAKKAIQKSAQAFLVEGYFDCVAMVQHGYPNTVATLGTACSAEHLKLLAQYADTLYVTFDGDAAGLRAMLRLTQLCWHANINIRIICLPKNEDPASFLGKGNELSSYVACAQDIFTFFISNASDQFKSQSLKGKLAIVQELVSILSNMDDRLKQVLLLQEAADNLHIPLSVLQHECDMVRQRVQVSIQKQEDHEHTVSALEKKLCAAILDRPQLLEREEIQWLIPLLPQDIVRILTQFQQLPEKTFAALEQVLVPEDKQLTYEVIMSHDTIQEHEQEELIAAVIKQYWKVVTQKIKEKVVQAQQENDTQQVTHLLEYMQELKKKMLMRSSS